MNGPSFESFEKAFRGHQQCACGIIFWDAYNGGYSVEDSEYEALESLKAQGKARSLDHAVGSIEFEGREYVDGCECWHERATRVIGFLDGHAEAIASYLSLEKKRKQREADAAPVVT